MADLLKPFDFKSKKIKVLYVDDEPANLRTFMSLFKRDFDVLTGAGMQEGMEQLRKQDIQVVISDYNMPGKNGVQFLEAVKESWPETKRIILTGYGDLEVATQAINRSKVDRFMNKPFDFNELNAVLQDYSENYLRAKQNELLMQELEITKQTLNLVVETALDAILVVDQEQNIQMINDSAVRMFGYSRDELLGANLDLLIPEEYKPSHRDHIKVFNEQHQQHRMMRSTSASAIDQEGKRFPIEVSISKMKVQGQTLFSAIIRDVSLQKELQKDLVESKQKLQDIFDSFMDVFLRVNHKGLVTVISPSVKDILGYDTKNLVGRQVRDFYVYPEERDRLLAEVANHGKVEDFQAEVYDAAGEKRMTSVNAKFYKDEYGEFGIESVLRDITRLKEAEAQIILLNQNLESKVIERTRDLNKAKDELAKSLAKEKELSKMKSRFVATASHQFRTPLTVIETGMDILRIHKTKEDGDLASNFDPVYDRILSQIERMTVLMDKVLTLGNIDEGKINLKSESVDIVAMLEEIKSKYDGIQTDGRSLDLEIKGAPVSLVLDQLTMSHAISNIVSNAFKYSEGKNNPNMTVVFESKVLRIVVRDQGIGISAEDIDRITEPFYRSDRAYQFQGTGLGLSIAKEYLELNNFSLSVKSEQEKFTEFIATKVLI